MVGERGFEPPTPWSRTRCSTRLSHSPNLRLEGRLRTGRLLVDAFVNARELQQSVSEERPPTPRKPYTAVESPPGSRCDETIPPTRPYRLACSRWSHGHRTGAKRLRPL